MEGQSESGVSEVICEKFISGEYLFLKVKDHRGFVFTKKPLTLRDCRNIWRAGGVLTVFPTAEHAFHSHPLGDHDSLRFDPLEISISVTGKQLVQWLILTAGQIRLGLHLFAPW